MNDLSRLTNEDKDARERIESAAKDMVARTCSWSDMNTGSWNIDGLNAFSGVLADAFSELDADIRLQEAPGFDTIDSSGNIQTIHTAPILRASARMAAPVQIVLTGHYDTVFPKGTFEGVTDLGDGRFNGPGLADMKGGLCVMLEALKAFEAGPFRDRLGYQALISA